MSVRIMAPDGSLGTVPEEKLADALEEGGRVMTPDLMREMRQAVFMNHVLFLDRDKRPTQRKRKSLVRGGKR